MISGTILHYEILERLGEARLLPISSGFGGQGGPVRRSTLILLRSLTW